MTQSMSINEIAQELEHQNQMIHNLKRRLNELELNKAKIGLPTEPHILTEIEDLQQEIQRRKKQIEDLQRRNNLINYSVPVSIDFNGKSRCTIDHTSGKVVIDFRNDQTWSGVAFQFAPALDVRGFTHLEINGTATQAFKLSIEYKIREGNELEVATKFLYQPFPATMQVSTIPIPLRYEGKVDEITLMFYVTGEASQVAIESIRLSR